MIHESYSWKREILRTAQYFKRLQKQRRTLSECQQFLIEKHVFFSFYAIRKLMEAKKLSNECTSKQVHAVSYPSTGKPITHFNWHRSDEQFDLENSKKETLTMLDLCHQIVHSYVFHIVSGESGGLSGFMVASDRRKEASLLCVNIEIVQELFESIAQDNVVSCHWTRDPESGKETFKLSNKISDSKLMEDLQNEIALAEQEPSLYQQNAPKI